MIERSKIADVVEKKSKKRKEREQVVFDPGKSNSFLFVLFKHLYFKSSEKVFFGHYWPFIFCYMS